MSGSPFDCYLCGTTNDPDADFCSKCSGQLLKLPDAGPDPQDEVGNASPSPQPSDFLADFSDDDPGHVDTFTTPQDQPQDQPAPNKRPKPPAMSVNTSVEDMRLSEALGLNDDVDDLDGLDIEVTSIPRARAAENIPHIGTQTAIPGSRTEFEDDEEVGKTAYVLLVLLFIAVGWLGYTTLLRGTSEPETIAFNDTTTTTIAVATTTTAAPDLSLEPDEVEFLYGPAIVRVIPYACRDGDGEAVGDALLGVALNDRSTLLPNNFPAEANVAQIITRTATSRNAIVSTEGDLRIATSNVLTTRHLDIDEISDEPFYYIGFDFETNEVTTTEAPQGLDAEISASETGALHSVRIGSSVFDAESLVDVDRSVEVDSELASRRASTACERASGLVFTEDPEQAAQNESGADPEEVDAE